MIIFVKRDFCSGGFQAYGDLSFMNTVISIVIWIFGITYTAIFFPVSIIIWFLLYPIDHKRSVIHWWLILQSCILLRLIPIWKIKVEGREKIEKGKAYILISNHQSILDILLINCLRYRFRWISKIENYKVPVLGWYLRMAKYITIDRGDVESKVEMFEKSALSLKEGISIMMFPEGTRSPDGEIGTFKLGAFQMALMTDKPILPVIIDGTGGILPKHGFVLTPGHNIYMKVLDPVHPGSFGSAVPEELALKFRNLLADELKKMREGH
jgi:1-acyl-sn-glycerol-3-phosphate acyltransferase